VGDVSYVWTREAGLYGRDKDLHSRVPSRQETNVLQKALTDAAAQTGINEELIYQVEFAQYTHEISEDSAPTQVKDTLSGKGSPCRNAVSQTFSKTIQKQAVSGEILGRHERTGRDGKSRNSNGI